MAAEARTGTRIMDRPEFKTKPKPLTRGAETTVREAVAAMCQSSYGSVIVVDGDDRVTGVFTERDLMAKVVNAGRDPDTVTLGEVMTRDPRLAREDDSIVDWLRIMSNERFRRLPVTDADGRIKAVFTQGDFVSYTWPDLIYQARQIARASLSDNFHYVLIVGGVALYTLLMIVVLQVAL
jgi:CBS domain-containing protein